MNRRISIKEIENDDLICPITYELFRDPVIAKDGHVYERQAITKWILEHGTSPFTREPLQINDLQPNDNLRRLATQRRNSTVSYNAQNSSIKLPPLPRMPKNNRQITLQQRYYLIRQSLKSKMPCIKLTCLVVCPVVVVLSIYLGLRFGLGRFNIDSTFTNITRKSNYSSSLTISNSVFIRPYSNTGNDSYYYEAIRVIIPKRGIYRFTSVSQINMYGYLYGQYFNDTNPYNNLLTFNDDDGGNQQFYLQFSLSVTNYTLVVTTFSPNVTGSFLIVVNGPARITFH